MHKHFGKASFVNRYFTNRPTHSIISCYTLPGIFHVTISVKTVWIKIKPDILPGLILFQTVYIVIFES